MAVLLQQLVGRRFGDRFYPHVAGVAQSYNFYPLEPMQPADGLVTAALGLGRTVVQDGVGLRFCPKYPQVLPQMSSPAEALRYSQRRFYALDLTRSSGALGEDDAANLLHLELDDAEQDGALAAAASTYVEESDRIYDTIHKPGARLVTFAPMLRQGRFPLAEIVGELLSVAGEGLATPVEMEFAVTLNEGDEPDEFSVLQLRPMVSPSGPGACCDVRSLAPGERSVVAGPALGNGLIPDIRDVVYVHPDRFDSGRTERIAAHVGRINDVLVRQRRPYMILAPGRWGTSDRFLGIPVSWAQVAGARVMVELAHEGFRPDPSQGTHFFHNITALQIGYFSVDLTDPGHTADLDWLESLPAVQELGRVRHVEVPDGLDVRIDGTERRGIAVARAGSG